MVRSLGQRNFFVWLCYLLFTTKSKVGVIIFIPFMKIDGEASLRLFRIERACQGSIFPLTKRTFCTSGILPPYITFVRLTPSFSRFCEYLNHVNNYVNTLSGDVVAFNTLRRFSPKLPNESI